MKQEGPRDWYLVTELVEGGELFDRLVTLGAYSEDEAACVMRDIVEALRIVHESGVIHGDVKPENVLLTSSSGDGDGDGDGDGRGDGSGSGSGSGSGNGRVHRVKLCDFGSAILIANDVGGAGGGSGGSTDGDGDVASWVRPGYNSEYDAGTWAYWPPEMVSSSTPHDQVCACLLECRSGGWCSSSLLTPSPPHTHTHARTHARTHAHTHARTHAQPHNPTTAGEQSG